MENESNPKIEDKNNFINTVSVGIALIIVSGFLYLNPEFLIIDLVSYIIGSIIGVIGLFGTILEIGQRDKKFSSSITNIAVAGLFGVIVYGIHYLFSNIIVNVIVLILSFIVIFALVSGVLQIVHIIVTEHDIKQSSIKISVFVLNLLIFILTALQILQIFKII